MSRTKYMLLFVGVVLFCVLTGPSNHSEAEDTYTYSLMAEQGAWSEMFHQHHLLYLPVARVVYRAVQLLGFSGRALPVLIGLSMVCGALSICLFATMLARKGISRWWILPLLFSYGFWRYACAAEIYLPALASVCAVWFFASRPNRMAGAVCCAVFSILLHLVSLPAVFAAGLLYVRRKEWKQAGLFYLITGGTVAAVYGLVQGTVGTVVFHDVGSVRGSLFEVSAWLKAGFAFGHNLLSGNFLFSIPAVAERLADLFPYQMLQEELFMGQQAGIVWQFAACVTFFASLFALGAASFFFVRNGKLWLCPMAVWLAGNVAMALLFEPANPEMWIFVLLPFWFLTAQAVSSFRCYKIIFPALVTVMLLHNAVGGISFVKRKEGDYCRQKAAWVVEQAKKDDLILTAESHSFVTYLQYHTRAQVVDSKFITPDIWRELAGQVKGRVFVFSDVTEPLPAVARRSLESVKSLRLVADGLIPSLEVVHTNRFSIIYERDAAGSGMPQ